MQKMNETLLGFGISEQRFAIPVGNIERVIRAVAVTNVPDAKSLIYGMMDLQGQVIPVINLRERFNLVNKPIQINDRFVIIKSGGKKFALVVDKVENIIKVTPENLSSIKIPANDRLISQARNIGLEMMQFISDEIGIIIIYDIEKLLGSEAVIELDDFFKQRDE